MPGLLQAHTKIIKNVKIEVSITVIARLTEAPCSDWITNYGPYVSVNVDLFYSCSARLLVYQARPSSLLVSLHAQGYKQRGGSSLIDYMSTESTVKHIGSIGAGALCVTVSVASSLLRGSEW